MRLTRHLSLVRPKLDTRVLQGNRLQRIQQTRSHNLNNRRRLLPSYVQHSHPTRPRAYNSNLTRQTRVSRQLTIRNAGHLQRLPIRARWTMQVILRSRSPNLLNSLRSLLTPNLILNRTYKIIMTKGHMSRLSHLTDDSTHHRHFNRHLKSRPLIVRNRIPRVSLMKTRSPRHASMKQNFSRCRITKITRSPHRRIRDRLKTYNRRSIIKVNVCTGKHRRLNSLLARQLVTLTITMLRNHNATNYRRINRNTHSHLRKGHLSMQRSPNRQCSLQTKDSDRRYPSLQDHRTIHPLYVKISPEIRP